MGKSLGKAWHFIWEENSALSWIVNVVLAFVIIKFLVYPGLGFVLQTENPVVAVVSCSMEHRSTDCGAGAAYRICSVPFPGEASVNFDDYWNLCGDWYGNRSISKTDFSGFSFSGGFNKGDLIILKGKKPADIVPGDVIVFQGPEPDPIIHRVVSKEQTGGKYFFSTKGDHNSGQLPYEKSISESQIIGKASVRIPFLGNVKLVFTSLIGALRGAA